MPNRMIAVFTLAAAAAVVADEPLVIAHRGASHDAPENTVAAFKLAWQRDADGIEGDFFLTKDGRIVCIHDKTTERLAPRSPKLSVSDSTAAELFRLDVGSWKHERYAGERVPLLSDVMATVPEGGRFFVEVKTGPEIVTPLLNELDAGGVPERLLTVIAFDAEVIRAVRTRRPSQKANWLTGFKQDERTGAWSPSLEEVLTTLDRCGATGLGCRAERAVVDAAFVAAVREAGFELHVWTVNDPADARHWAMLGVDSITTDRPAVIRGAVETAGTK